MGCEFDSTCGVGEICDRNTCIAGCRDDSACSKGSYCNFGTCTVGCLSTLTCASGSTCDTTARQCVPTCTGSAQCAAGQFCGPDHRCVPGCDSDDRCPTGQYCDVSEQCETGMRWTIEPVPSGMLVTALSGASPHDIWGACLDGGIVYSRGDGVWTAQATPVHTDLTDIWAASPTDIFAVGVQGTILYSNGDGSWVSIASPMQWQDLTTVGGTSASDLWVAGVDQTLMHRRTDGGWEFPYVLDVGYNGTGHLTISAISRGGSTLCIGGAWPDIGAAACRAAGATDWPRAYSGWSDPPRSLLVTGPTSIFALVYGELFQWDGTTDPVYSATLGEAAGSLWANSPTELYAGGKLLSMLPDAGWTVQMPLSLAATGGGGSSLWGPGPGELYRNNNTAILHGRR